MTVIKDIETLSALYDEKHPLAVTKVRDHITPLYRKWIENCRFVMIATVGPEGTDASPRGDIGAVARVADAKTLLIPDWRGNNRLDTLKNIVRDPRVSLSLMNSRSNIVVRVNGQAEIVKDDALNQSFVHNGMTPRTVIIIKLGEIYFQCPKAIMRSQIWDNDAQADVPTAGEFLNEVAVEFDGEVFDKGYSDYAKTRMW